jgi:hypothetical protein
MIKRMYDTLYRLQHTTVQIGYDTVGDTDSNPRKTPQASFHWQFGTQGATHPVHAVGVKIFSRESTTWVITHSGHYMLLVMQSCSAKFEADNHTHIRKRRSASLLNPFCILPGAI